MRVLPVFLASLLLSAVAPAALTAQEETPQREPGLYATLETSMGTIVIKLYEKESPATVRNFTDLATGKKPWKHTGTGQVEQGKPFYDGLLFHRVIPNFMIQTGAHLPDGNARVCNPIPDEFDNDLKFDGPGVVGMANAGPDTGSSQFFITHRETSHLNGKHTIFGRVVEGQDVVVAIGNVARDSNDKPRADVVLEHVTIERVE